jgi:hypothetical protein
MLNIPYSSSAIKSIQRGLNNDGSHTISSVDTTKSVCNLLSSEGFAISSGSDESRYIRLRLETSTSIEIISSTNATEVSWEVIEYV